MSLPQRKDESRRDGDRPANSAPAAQQQDGAGANEVREHTDRAVPSWISTPDLVGKMRDNERSRPASVKGIGSQAAPTFP